MFFSFFDKIYFFHRKWLGLTLEKKLIIFLMNMAKLQERTFWNHFFIFLGKFKIMDFHYKKSHFSRKTPNLLTIHFHVILIQLVWRDIIKVVWVLHISVCIFRNSLKNSSISLFDTQLIFSECSFIFFVFFCSVSFQKSSINQPLPIQQKFVFFLIFVLFFKKWLF